VVLDAALAGPRAWLVESMAATAATLAAAAAVAREAVLGVLLDAALAGPRAWLGKSTATTVVLAVAAAMARSTVLAAVPLGLTLWAVPTASRVGESTAMVGAARTRAGKAERALVGWEDEAGGGAMTKRRRVRAGRKGAAGRERAAWRGAVVGPLSAVRAGFRRAAAQED